MPTLIPHYTIRVHRDGKNIEVPRGRPFEFTKEEVDTIYAHDKSALRKPVNETGGVVVARNETDLTIRGQQQPDANVTGDANLLRRAPSKGGRTSRNQGGSLEEGQAAAGVLREEDQPPSHDDDEL